MPCHYDPSTERFTECDGHHRCICPDDETVTRPIPRAPVVRCACGRPYSSDAWQALPRIGDQVAGCPAGVVLEMRECACHSHMVRARRGTEYITDAEYARLESIEDGGSDHGH